MVGDRYESLSGTFILLNCAFVAWQTQSKALEDETRSENFQELRLGIEHLSHVIAIRTMAEPIIFNVIQGAFTLIFTVATRLDGSFEKEVSGSTCTDLRGPGVLLPLQEQGVHVEYVAWPFSPPNVIGSNGFQCLKKYINVFKPIIVAARRSRASSLESSNLEWTASWWPLT